MEDLTLDFQEITEICESSMNECCAQQQKAREREDLDAELMWLLAEVSFRKLSILCCIGSDIIKL